MNVCVRPMANAGMMMEPPRLRHAIHDLRKQRPPDRRRDARDRRRSIRKAVHPRSTGRRYRIIQNRLVVTSDVAGKHHDLFLSVFGDGQFQAGGAQDVSCIIGRHMEFRTDVECADARHRFQSVAAPDRRLRWYSSGSGSAMAAPTYSLRVLRVFFLQMRGIFQKNRGQVDRGGIGENRAAIPVLNQHRQPPGVVQVRVREHQHSQSSSDRSAAASGCVPSARRALKYTAIDEQSFARRLDEIF